MIYQKINFYFFYNNIICIIFFLFFLNNNYNKKNIIMICLFFILILYIQTYYNQLCEKGKTCNECLSINQDCGWCSSVRMCLVGNNTGPSHQYCSPRSWHINKCIDCSEFKYCKNCINESDDCGWNNYQHKCVTSTAINITFSCSCNTFTRCNDCVKNGCIYCIGIIIYISYFIYINIQDNAICMEPGDNTELECQKPTVKCNCNLFQNCSTCAIQEDICKWYLFYLF